MAETHDSRPTAFHSADSRRSPTSGWTCSATWRRPSSPTPPTSTAPCREAAGLMDFSMLRKVDIDGPGARRRSQQLVTRDLRGSRGPDRLRGAHRRRRQDGRRLHLMIRSPDRSASAGRTTRLRDLYGAAEGTPIDRAELTDALPHLCLQGPAQPGILQAVCRPRPLERRRFRTTRSARTSDRRHPGLHDPARLHGRARLRAVGRRSALSSSGTRSSTPVRRRDARDRHGRARPLPDRGRLHHRRRRVRPVRSRRTSAASGGRSRSTRRSARPRRLGGIARRPTLRLASVVLESGGDDASGAALAVDGERWALSPRRSCPRSSAGRSGSRSCAKTLAQRGDPCRRAVGSAPSPARSSGTRSTTPSGGERRELSARSRPVLA